MAKRNAAGDPKVYFKVLRAYAQNLKEAAANLNSAVIGQNGIVVLEQAHEALEVLRGLLARIEGAEEAAAHIFKAEEAMTALQDEVWRLRTPPDPEDA